MYTEKGKEKHESAEFNGENFIENFQILAKLLIFETFAHLYVINIQE